MTSSAMYNPLVVSHDGTAGPYIPVTPEQLGPVLEELRAAGIDFQVDEGAVLRGRRPLLSVINLGPGADVRRVEEILGRVESDLRSRRAGRKPPVVTENAVSIKAQEQEMQELIRRIEEADSAGGWTRRTEIEARWSESWPSGPRTWCFSKAIGAARREVVVWLAVHGPAELHLSNVIPLQGREPLGIDLFNEVLTDFCENLIGPLTHGLSIRVLQYPAFIEPTIDEILTTEAMTRLQSFSATANKSLLHSLDLQRWDAFIVRTHLDDTMLTPEVLASWLEDEGWSEEQRNRLVSEYERGRDLLSRYDEEWAAR
jgi:hypothetical protein